MRIAISQYGSRYGGNPVGINSEITSALNGGNTNGAKFINEESGLRINGRGELVDYWGTPFFFHQLSGTEMEIRSAGLTGLCGPRMTWSPSSALVRRDCLSFSGYLEPVMLCR